MRIGVYVDGFNLYYGARGLCGRGTPGWRWLDLRALATDLAGRRSSWPGARIHRVVYCTARIDGASAWQAYGRLYLPLMAPALAVAAVYALLLSWNDYLYQSVLLSVRNMTLSVIQGQLFLDIDASYNAMMAAALIYVLPPVLLLFGLRRHVMTSLSMREVGAP